MIGSAPVRLRRPVEKFLCVRWIRSFGEFENRNKQEQSLALLRSCKCRSCISATTATADSKMLLADTKSSGFILYRLFLYDASCPIAKWGRLST